MVLSTPHTTQARARDFSSRQGQPIVAIIIHATAGSDSLNWLKGNVNGTSIHVLIRKDGTCFQMVPDDSAAHHVGFSKMVHNGVTYSEKGKLSCNHITLGIELENLNNGKDPYPEVQLRAAAWWVAHWRSVHGSLQVLMHRDIDQHGKSDAAGLQISDIMRFIDESPTPVGTPPSGLTADVQLLARPRATVEQALAFLRRRKVHPTYTVGDQALITNFYWLSAQMVGLDPLLAFSQMVHETGALGSWWSLRPRRNPAGIGVTGETSRAKKQPGIDWAFDGSSKLWKRGYSFASWDLSVKAHLGHLLVYALHDAQLTPAQRQMIVFDPRAAAVPEGNRGCVTLKGLNGKWAVPGTTYAERIISIANEICS